MDTDISNTPSSQQIARTVSQWCRECELSRDWYYSAPEADRPITVRINGVPRVIESPSEWRARMENRRSVTTWCKAAGLSRRAYYGLSVEDRPHMDGRHVVEPPKDWWARMAKKQEASV